MVKKTRNQISEDYTMFCPKCNSVFEYDSDDIVPHGSSTIKLKCISCPCCGKRISVIETENGITINQ